MKPERATACRGDGSAQENDRAQDKKPEAKADKSVQEVAIAAKVMQPGGYPQGLMRAGVEGAVLLYLKLTLGGDVEDVIAVQSSLYNVRGRPQVLDQARKRFEDAAIAAAKRWKFKVDSTKPSPTADDLTVTVPVVYSMSKRQAGDAPGQWRAELRSERAIVPWLLDAPAAQSVGISDLDGDEVLPVASAFKVGNGVIGNAL